MRIDKLKLLAGLPIEVEGVGSIHPLTLRDIAEIGEKTYSEYISILNINKSNINLPEGFDDISNFEVILLICMQDKSAFKIFLDALGVFLKDIIHISDDGLVYVGDFKEQKIIHKGNYEEIVNIIKLQNKIEIEKEELRAGNKIADEFMKKMEDMKNKYKKYADKKEPSLYDLVSSVAWRTNIGRSVWDLTLYELYDAISRLQVIEHYDHTMLGIYTGNIDTKKMKNDLKNLNWIKKIE